VKTESRTTEEAAKAVGITRVTLQAWIAKRKLKVPRTRIVNGRAVRLWTDSDLAALRNAKKKIYMKGLGRPKKHARK